MAVARREKELEYIYLLKPELNQEVVGRDERARINDDQSPKALEIEQDDIIEVQEQTGGGDTDETEF